MEETVEEMSIDGGKVRLRTPEGEPSEWRDYKAVNLHESCVAAFFQDNEQLVNWVNVQSLSDPLTCIGDGHDGIWNVYTQIGNQTQRREILDWYHLVENLGKVGGSVQRLDAVETCLWQGDVEGAIAQFEDWQHERVTNFVSYLNKHRQRIVNYGYYSIFLPREAHAALTRQGLIDHPCASLASKTLYQAEGVSIGSGAIESTVKQLGRRIKISGAQWDKDNVPQVLKQRCAYLNGQFST
ncbi:MAG: hypothetical protein IGS16_13450 [Thermoleptolyngbya sp. C42_A2020_037]|nr:hypothetical protein [Thermoleptolyngbya sp. C42_A2020_037]